MLLTCPPSGAPPENNMTPKCPRFSFKINVFNFVYFEKTLFWEINPEQVQRLWGRFMRRQVRRVK